MISLPGYLSSERGEVPWVLSIVSRTLRVSLVSPLKEKRAKNCLVCLFCVVVVVGFCFCGGLVGVGTFGLGEWGLGECGLRVGTWVQPGSLSSFGVSSPSEMGSESATSVSDSESESESDSKAGGGAVVGGGSKRAFTRRVVEGVSEEDLEAERVVIPVPPSSLGVGGGLGSWVLVEDAMLGDPLG